MTEHRFPVGDRPRIFFRLPLGAARVVQGDPGEVVVQLEGSPSSVARFIVEMRGDEVAVEPERSSVGRWSAVDLTIRVAAPAEIRARLAAADLEVATPVATLQVESASGDVAVGEVAEGASVRSASGDVRVAAVGGRVDVAAASGDVRVDRVAGDASIKSASGDVLVEEASGDLVAKSASGDVIVTRFEGASLDVKTLSGDVTIGVTSGRKFDVSFQTLSGTVRTDFPVGHRSESVRSRLSVKTMSGDVTIKRAPTG